jgi:Fe2+ transport system protein FeoA
MRIAQQEQPVLQYLQSLGLVPRAHVTVAAVAPFGGALTVRVRAAAAADEATHALGTELAARILVTCGGAVDAPEQEKEGGPR